MASRRLVILPVLLAALLTLPASASFAPTPEYDPWAELNMDAFADELLAAEMSAEERADVEATLEWLRANPDALLEEPPAPEREYTMGDGKDIEMDILRTDDRSKPVLMIHGRDNYDMGGYGTLRSYYINTGFGTVHRVGYYGGECNVEHRAEHHGSHSSHYGGSGEHSSYTGCNGVAGAQVHDLDTDIRHIGWHVAWMINDHWSASGVYVDTLGHSMGGLLVRYAIAMSGSSGWPAKLRVEDSTTMGSPHGGLGTSWCKLSPWSDVRQMCSDSSFITYLKNSAQNPQGNGGTDWTVMGSDCDGWVAWNLAVDMQAKHKVVYVSPCYGHSDYYTDVSTASDATTDYMDAPSTSWSRWTSSPHSGRWTANAAVYGTW